MTIMPPIEMDGDGYPEEAWLAALGAADFTAQEAALYMVRQFPSDCLEMPQCSFDAARSEGGRYFRIEFSTDGWSGAESLIAAVLQNPMIKLRFHTEWRRGGHYVFEVPVHYLMTGEP